MQFQVTHINYDFYSLTFLKNLKSTSSRLVVQINEATALRTDLDCGLKIIIIYSTSCYNLQEIHRYIHKLYLNTNLRVAKKL